MSVVINKDEVYKIRECLVNDAPSFNTLRNLKKELESVIQNSSLLKKDYYLQEIDSLSLRPKRYASTNKLEDLELEKSHYKEYVDSLVAIIDELLSEE